MKIAFYTETYLPNKDGVVTSILTFRKSLENMGHEVYIFCAGDRKAKRENKDPRVFYHISAPFQPYPTYKIALFPFLSYTKIKDLGVDVVHSHGMASMGIAALEAAKTQKKPLVGTFHTLIPEATHYLSKRPIIKKTAEKFAWRYLKWYYNNCDATIAPSVVIKEMLEEHGVENVKVIPTGIDIQRFNTNVSGEALRKRLDLGSKKIVLTLGRLVLEKNLDVLINSALLILEEVPECKFLVVGEGPAANYYKKLIRKNGLEKWFLFINAIVPYDEVPSLYAASDLFVIPSKFETQGLVVLEAMACGKPVVGADYLALKEIIRDNYNGAKFSPDSPEDCAEKIIMTLKNKDKFKENARKTAEAFSTEKCANKLVKLYEELVI